MIEREMLGSERAVWKAGAISLNIVLAAKIKGRVTPDKLAKAWLFLQDKHPLLKCHLERRDDRIFLVSSGTSAIPLRLVESSGADCWQQEALAELSTPFTSFSPQPLLRAVLISTSTGVELIITCHHCLADGLSVAYLLRDLLHYLTGQAELVPTSNPDLLFDNLLPPHVKTSRINRLAIRLLNLFSPIIGSTPIATNLTMPRSKLLNWSLSQHRTTALLATCRHHKVTVHAALLTAFQMAQQQVQGNDKDYFQHNYSPVNGRGFLTTTIGDNFGLYATEAYIPSPYDPNLNFWKNAKIIQQKITAGVDPAQILRPVLLANLLKPALLDRLMLYLYHRQQIKFGYVISNLGVIDLPKGNGALVVEKVWGPVFFVKRAEKTLSVVTVAGQLSFTMTYRPNIISPDIIRKIKEKSEFILADICQ